MNLSEFVARYPRSVEFAMDGSGSLTTSLSRMFAAERPRGSGRPRDYSDVDVRLFVAYQVVRRGLMRLGVRGRGGWTADQYIFEQLRAQIELDMPDRIRVHAADVVLTVEVPFVVHVELNAARDRVPA